MLFLSEVLIKQAHLITKGLNEISDLREMNFNRCDN